MRGDSRSILVLSFAGALTVMAAATPVAGQSTHAIQIGATVGGTTSLRLSTSVLTIDAQTNAGSTVVGTIEFRAGARTRLGGEVLLTVESLRSLDELVGGAAAGDVAIDYAGSDEGVVAGTLSTTAHVAARWTGSGLRQASLTFKLSSAGGVQGGELPLRFVLVTP